MKTKHAKAIASLIVLLTVGLSLIVSPTVFGNCAVNVKGSASGQEWMKSLDGCQQLSQLSIPGTHNSAALFEPIRGTARCQNLTIPRQLDAGVRFLDIRCRHQNDAFAIYHGPVSQHESFANVVNYATDFLRAHPSETIILSVKEEYEAQNNTRSFEATFADAIARNPAPWLLDSTAPTLNRARGKIVLLRRFKSAKPLGIDASNWPDNAAFVTNNLRVQDNYKVSDNDDKWNSIVALLTATRDDAATPPALPLALNFSSGVKSGLFGIPNIPSVASEINPRLAQFFATNPRGNFGCVIMDFADDKLCATIYRTNGR